MPKHCTILISSAGRRGQLVECFRESARELGVELRVIAADIKPDLSAACATADIAVSVPPCRSPEFAPALLAHCRNHGVALVVPTIDTELTVLSAERESFAGVGVSIAVSAPEVVAIARDKKKTADLIARAGICTPVTVSGTDFKGNPSTLRWPVIVKPRGGSSSIGIVRPADVETALEAAESENVIVQELWAGREYTVNMFFDRGGALRCAVPHLRMETRAGEVSKGRTEDIPLLREVARKLAYAIPGARGALCFQAIVKETGEYAVFEINARFGGGYPLAHRSGACFTRWLLEETLGLPATASDTWKPGVLMLRYDTAIFRGD